jgi:NAD(P)-dependent dehydrogenase (short-subunit alcohol dehydrogenase family)
LRDDVAQYVRKIITRTAGGGAMTGLRFDGRVAVVTGGGTGLGASHARLLASRGAWVIVNDLDGHAADSVARQIDDSGGNAVALASDVATEAGAGALIAAALGEFGRIDIVVNNAGVLRSAPFSEMTVDLWDHVVAVNLRGTFLVTHAAWPHLAAQGYGRVVSTTSNSGLLGIAGSSAYASAKAAVWGLTRSLALEGEPLGINVNAVAPLAYTAMSQTSKIAPKAWQAGEGDAWSRRLDVTQVSPVVAWLAHEDCTLNGKVLSAVGGRVARFAMRVTDGFDVEHLTIEDVRDNESLVLADDDVGIEYTAAHQEGRDMHRRLLGD